MSDPRLPDAIALARAGQKFAARQLLLEILQTNPQEEAAWLWLADTAGKPGERMQVLQEGLRRLPHSQMLAQALAVIRSQPPKPPAAEPVPVPPATAVDPTLPLEPPVDALEDTAPPQPAPTPATPDEVLRAEVVGAMPALEDVDEAHRPHVRRRALWLALIPVIILAVAAVYFLLLQPAGVRLTARIAATATPTPGESMIPDPQEATASPVVPAAATPAPTPTPLSFTAVQLPQSLEPITAANIKRLNQVAALSIPYGVFSPDWQSYAAANQNSLNIWEVESGRLLHVFSDHTDTIWSLAYSQDGTRIASGSLDRSVRIWDLVEDELYLALTLERALAQEDYFLGNYGPRGYDVAFSPDGSVLAGGLTDAIVLWDANTGERTGIITADLGGEMLTFSPRGDYLLDGAPGYISQIDLESGEVLSTYEGRGKSFPVPPGFAISPDGSLLAVEVDGIMDTVELALFDLRTKQYLRSLTGLRDTIDRVAFSPDGALVAGGGSEGKILIWNASSGALLHTLPAGTVSTLEFSPDARLLRNGDQLWGVLPPGASPPLITGKPLQLTNDFERIASAPAAGYGTTLLSSLDDGLVYLSNTLEGALANRVDAAGASAAFGDTFALDDPATPVSLGDRLLFTAIDPEIHKTGLYHLHPGADEAGLLTIFRGGDVTDHQPAAAASLGGQAVFALTSASAPAVFIYATDGTATGTLLVSEIAGQAAVVDALVWQDQWYLVLEDAARSHRALWRSDGSAAGLLKLADLPQGSPDLPADRLVLWGNSLAVLHFSANGSALWRSDGTAAGTLQAAPLFSNADSFPLTAMTVLGDDLLFQMADPAGKVLLYAIGGTGGARLLANQPGTLAGATAQPLVVMDGRAYWMILTEDGGAALYSVDASGEAPLAVTEFPPAPRNPGSGQLALLDRMLFFTAPDAQSGWSLWRTDGTPSGTRQVTPNRAFDLLPAGNALYFAVDQPGSYTGQTTTLWKYIP
ncbi:MAG: hypothetical protein HPY76_00810 [Anaerolineae bacterium]|nr:hypothetical protein [Anaerolineae bacterium]